MDGYLKGYYGYKNFGDELLFFGIIKWILTNYSLDTLYVEVGHRHRMNQRLEMNVGCRALPTGLPAEDGRQVQSAEGRSLLDKVQFVEIKQHKNKLIGYFKKLLGQRKYKNTLKFFGGGEVLTDERKFPYDGRNIPLLFSHSVRKGQFVLLGGVATPHLSRTKFLYKLLFRKAQRIITRDPVSFGNVENYVTLSKAKSISKKQLYPSVRPPTGQAGSGGQTITEGHQEQSKIILHQDFAVDLINQAFQQENDKVVKHEKHILININHKENTAENREKIIAFCRQYPLHQKIFFPCDMEDDAKEYKSIKQDIPELIYYNWTEHSIDQILNMFLTCDGGIGCRLHFLLPLKLYKKTFEAIPYAEKIEKMIIK